MATWAIWTRPTRKSVKSTGVKVISRGDRRSCVEINTPSRPYGTLRFVPTHELHGWTQS